MGESQGCSLCYEGIVVSKTANTVLIWDKTQAVDSILASIIPCYLRGKNSGRRRIRKVFKCRGGPLVDVERLVGGF
jgi:hypothetical protein